MGKNSKHHRKQNAKNNREKKAERRKILSLPAQQVLPGLPAPRPQTRPVFVFDPISVKIRHQAEPLNPRLPVRTREGMPAVIVSVDYRNKDFPVRAAVLRGPSSYVGNYTLKGMYTPRRDSNPLDLFNCTRAEWCDMMGKNWNLSEDRKAIYPTTDPNDEIPIL